MDKTADLVAISYSHPILLYDGDCILCSKTVKWLLKQDVNENFLFCALQSQEAQLLEGPHFNSDGTIDTVVLLDNGTIYDRSDVTFKILKILGRGWLLLTVFQWVPKKIRDAIYNLIARNRYKWFGLKSNCLVPDANIRDRFIGLS